MSDFITVCKARNIREGHGKSFTVAGRAVALFLVDGQSYALDDYSPHLGSSPGPGASSHRGESIGRSRKISKRLFSRLSAKNPRNATPPHRNLRMISSGFLSTDQSARNVLPSPSGW